ncbi:MAG TPA: sigma-70 family RNA polymerase sigma factor [Myxococcales bacterium]|nr:sigma-70 family RNA polymerase sigma factor [Myxococcales bacterium]
MRLGTGSEDRLGWELRCLEEVRRGNRSAFGELYAAFAPPLYAQVLLPRLGSAAAAEEALAETFRAALEHLAGYRPQGGSLFGWLARIAVNKATDLHRERARTGKALASFESLIAPLREGAPGGAAEAERQLDQRRLRAAVDEALAQISPRYRRAIDLRMLEDLPRSECARRMEITVGNFDVLLLRALRAFRGAWVDRHGERWEEP